MQGQRITRRTFLAATATISSAIVAKNIATDASAATDTLKIRAPSDFTTLDPAFVADETAGFLIDAVFPKLISYKAGETWEWELSAASLFEQVDPTHVRFTLKPDLGWSNGFGPVTTEDVKYSFERVADPEMESPYVGDWEKLDHVEVIDERSGVIVLREPFAPLMRSTLPWETGAIISKRAVESVGGRIGSTAPAYGGAYMVENWEPRQKITLSTNPGWPGPMPHFDRINVIPIDDPKSAEIAFLANELDYTDVSVSSLSELRDRPPPNAKFKEYNALTYLFLGMNVQKKPLQDLRVRQAIHHAIDVSIVLEGAFFGIAPRAGGIVPPGMLGAREPESNVVDRQAAKDLLREAGYGSGFAITLDTINRTDWLSAAQIIQSQLADVGIDVEIRNHEPGAFWSLGDDSLGDTAKNLGLTLKEYYMAPDPSWATVWFTCSQVGVYNWERWCNEEFDRLHQKGLVESDAAKRDEMYRKMQDMMAASGAFVFLTHQPTAAIYRTSIVPGALPNGRPKLTEFRRA